MKKKMLLLHGRQQTGGLLLGRMAKLRKKLAAQLGVDIVTLDAPFPHPDDAQVRQWWDRQDNVYEGLEESIQAVKSVWTSDCVGLMGFSQGARLAHLVVSATAVLEPPVQWVILASGYDAPIPENMVLPVENVPIHVPSLHVWGETDTLVPPERSEALLQYYNKPARYVHSGGHHVPMKAESCRAYIEFIQMHLSFEPSDNAKKKPTASTPPPVLDPETALLQQEEVQALQAIYPEEFTLLSTYDSTTDTYAFPLQYEILVPGDPDTGIWPPHPVKVRVTTTPLYPSLEAPVVQLVHDNNGAEFSSTASERCYQALLEAFELGMPSVMNGLYAVTEYFESGAMGKPSVVVKEMETNETVPDNTTTEITKERKEVCNQEGLTIASSILAASPSHDASTTGRSSGGSWHDYTIGLVGKPSAGKSTLFNTATGFSRQQKSGDDILTAGAAVAPHPFTTIDPNRGVCFVPAPKGSCPERDSELSNSHGRDRHGRRLIPVILKDVAGLVPGAYQGRGRGNQFLNDLTDADVMLHVVDVSGTADAEGNVCGAESLRHPMNDMEWIRNELLEWVYANLLHKWDTIQRKGRVKLVGMFSGYGQNQATTERILQAVEAFMLENTHRTMVDMGQWDGGDIYRLVSAFLGVRFPLALALNKMDLPSSKAFIRDIQAALPIHGSLVGTPLSARSEMEHVRRHMGAEIQGSPANSSTASPPDGTLDCLRAAMSLCEPLLVFPVSDFDNYSPLVGMNKHSTGAASLPNPGMIASLVEAGGCAPTMWDGNSYKILPKQAPKLRDVLLMKPGSNVEDVFLALKRVNAVSGEFIRAEAASDLGVPPKPIPKHQIVTKTTRIIKIMTNKKTTS